MRHMLDYARETVAMVSGRSRGDVDTDRMLQLALTRLLEMIGEAASRVTVPGRARYRDIPTTPSGRSSRTSSLSSSPRWNARSPDT